MNYSKIIPCDLANGKGVRVSLFVSGCQFHCPECFNEEAQDYEYGEPYTDFTEKKLLNLLSLSTVDGLSILGGDPLWQDIHGIIKLQNLANHVYYKLGKNVWIWTGFKFEDIVAAKEKAYSKMLFQLDDKSRLDIARYNLIASCDVLVDGQFDANLKDLSLPFRGSSNQRIIDVQKSTKQDEVILYEL